MCPLPEPSDAHSHGSTGPGPDVAVRRGNGFTGHTTICNFSFLFFFELSSPLYSCTAWMLCSFFPSAAAPGEVCVCCVFSRKILRLLGGGGEGPVPANLLCFQLLTPCV